MNTNAAYYAVVKRHVSQLFLPGIYLELTQRYSEILLRWFSTNVDYTSLTQRDPLKGLYLIVVFCDSLN